MNLSKLLTALLSPVALWVVVTQPIDLGKLPQAQAPLMNKDINCGE
jgi:hypothetical protein